ncbi:glycosyltransferase family 2 protein [Desertivirga arenae]|uniref:glycosyltransferase family 2 protein n=1 Tax=Desertivirga arenae TaxID=2810309 RepID=UPI001A959F63|nr:glycosyltransferase family 2 protein [Pedobacter sp. SYSU D00823]
MKEGISTIVHHFHLELTGFQFEMPQINKYSYYCVFWWKNIPLGDGVFESKKSYDGLAVKTKVWEAIQPSLRRYISTSSLLEELRLLFFLEKKLLFSTLLEEVFGELTVLKEEEKLDVSVVICTRNRSSALKDCLYHIFSQQYLPREVIVVDNAPSDDSTERVVLGFKQAGLKYVREQRAGLDVARNTGAKAARGSIVLYTDDDVKVHPLWVYQTWREFEKGDLDALTGLIIASSLETESQQIFERFWSFNRGYKDIKFDKSFLNVKGRVPRVWEIGAGANMAFKKELLERVNFFDERLDVGAAGCSGDSEIWYRILLNGGKIVYSPRVVVFHEHRREISALHKQLYNYMRGHVAAALIQNSYHKEVGYKKYLYFDLPRYYLSLIKLGFPKYTSRYKTLSSEIKGVISGVKFFNKCRNVPAINANS